MRAGAAQRWAQLLLACGLAALLCVPAEAQQRRRRKAAPVHPARTRRVAGAGKSKEQLERERQANLRQMQQTSQALSQTREKKKASLGQLNVIKEKLTHKQEVIQGISTQLRGINSDVQQTAQQVLKTQKSLAELKTEYARLVYTAAKTANGYNRLMFLFAAESFNQFALRLRYVRQYTEERQRQAARIKGAQTQLSQQLTGLTEQQRRKNSLLSSQLTENQSLLALKSQQDQVVQQLSQQEQVLRQELREREQALHRLDNLIAQRVRDEIARAARAARLAARRESGRSSGRSATRRRAADDDDDPSANPDRDETPAEAAADRRAVRIALTPEAALASSSFSGNRGRLPWPVVRGFISQRFGQHPHPVLKNVVVENRGVDIQTGTGETVRAVFGGKVLTIASIPGMHNIVMVQHGDFFTVYAKLRAVSVREGQQLEAREAIGTVAADNDGTPEVQFQIWHNSANLNPENWLSRRR